MSFASAAVPAATKITFPRGQDKDFFTDLRTEVNQYFATRGIASKGSPALWLKAAVLFTLYFGCYGLMLTGVLPLWFNLLLSVGMGVGMAGIGFSVAHDAIHGAFSKHEWVNHLMGYSMNLIGGSQYVWKLTHNLVHHTYTNIEGSDEDLELAPILRLSPAKPLWRIHRYQQYFAFLLYGFSTLFWVFLKDYKKMLQPKVGTTPMPRHPKREVVILFIGKLFYYFYMIVVPLWIMPITTGQFVLGFVIVHLTAGVILGVVFQLAHVVEGPTQPAPDTTGAMATPWAVHQLLTTADFAPGNRLLGWYVGGLNFQVVHHLFPKICSVHYPALQQLVVQVASRHQVSYYCHATLGQAVASHYRMLRSLGRS